MEKVCAGGKGARNPDGGGKERCEAGPWRVVPSECEWDGGDRGIE